MVLYKYARYYGDIKLKKDLFICDGMYIYLSDFIYTTEKGEIYEMHLTQGDHGKEHIIQNILNNDIKYVTNNVWFGDSEKTLIPNYEEILIGNENNKSRDKLIKELNIPHINTLNFVDEEQIEKIKRNCEEYILEYETKKINDKYMFDNNKRLAFCGEDGDQRTIRLTKEPHSIDEKERFVFRVGNDFTTETLDTYSEASKEYMDNLVSFTTNNRYYEEREKSTYYGYSPDYENELEFKTKKGDLTKEMIEYGERCDVIFCNSNYVNKINQKKYIYSDFGDDVYVLNLEMFQLLKNKYKLKRIMKTSKISNN